MAASKRALDFLKNGGNSYCYVSNASYEKEIVLFFFLRSAYDKFVEHAIKTSVKIFLVFCLLLLLNKCKEIVFFKQFVFLLFSIVV